MRDEAGRLRMCVVLFLHFLLMESRFGDWWISKPLWWLYDRLRPSYKERNKQKRNCETSSKSGFDP